MEIRRLAREHRTVSLVCLISLLWLGFSFLQSPAYAQYPPYGVYLAQSILADAIPTSPVTNVYPSNGVNVAFVPNTPQLSNSMDTGTVHGDGQGYSDTAEASTSGTAELGLLTASALATATSTGNGTGEGNAVGFLGWVDTFTIQSDLPNGTPVQFLVTETLQGKMVTSLGVADLNAQTFGYGGSSGTDFISPLSVSGGFDGMVQKTGIYTANVGLPFFIGQSVNFQTALTAGSDESGSDSIAGPDTLGGSLPDATFSVTVDPITPGVCYTTASGHIYYSSQSSNGAIDDTSPSSECASSPSSLTIVDVNTKAIVGNGGVPENVTVGQQVTLKASTQSGSGKITNPQWTIAGTRVKSYTPTQKKGAVTNLQSSDLSGKKVSFYWIDGSYPGSSETVQLKALVNGIPQTATAVLNVFKPEVTKFDIEPSMSGISIIRGKDGELYLSAGNSDSGSPGSAWDTLVEDPDGAASGSIGYIQIASFDRRWLKSGACAGEAIDSGLDQAKDGKGMLYEGFIYGADSELIGPGSPTTVESEDSPAQRLLPGTSSTSEEWQIGDTFALYLMFKPSGGTSIWVALSEETWGWNGVADWNGTEWTEKSGTIEGPPPNLVPTDDSLLPVWTHLATLKLGSCSKQGG
jgi:hypothetical protein